VGGRIRDKGLWRSQGDRNGVNEQKQKRKIVLSLHQKNMRSWTMWLISVVLVAFAAVFYLILRFANRVAV